MNNKERRFFNNDIEVRKLEDGKQVIEGYAIVFDSDSRNLGGFIETIDPGALNETDMSDVVALFNHDNNLILGRTAETLKLSVDKRGLKYTITPPDTQVGNDLVTSIKRKDIRGSSFQFQIAKDGDTWTEPEEKGMLWERRITDISKLWDVSPVTVPAYEATDSTVAKRELGLKRDEKEKKETDALELEQAKRQALINKHNQDLELFSKSIKLGEI